MTAPARLNLLMPWLNGDLDEHHYEGRNPEPVAVLTDYTAIRAALADFVASFDGSEGAAFLEVVDDPNPPHVRRTFKPPTDGDLDNLTAHLHILLEQGFDGPAGGVTVKVTGGEFTTLPATMFSPAASLRFAVRGAGRQKPAQRGSIVAGGVKALRDYRAAGAYVLQVMGPMSELVPFLVAHLLTAPDMVAMKRCKRRGCEHLIVTATAARGAPRQFCSGSCRELDKEIEQQIEQQRKTRRLK